MSITAPDTPLERAYLRHVIRPLQPDIRLELGHDALYGEGRYQSDEKLLKTMMKHEVRCSVADAETCRLLNHDLEVFLAA